MSSKEDIEAVIEYAEENLARIREIYEASLRAQEATSQLKVRIKNFLENERSALEYLAHAIVERYGKSGGGVCYPITRHPNEFPNALDSKLPGVKDARPDIADAIEKYQPFQPGVEWLGHLASLTNENKHRRLTPQTRQESRRIRAQSAGGGSVEWTPYSPGSGGVTFGPGVYINGVPVDPRTQRPVPSPYQTVTETIYVDWLFEQPNQSALATMEAIRSGVGSVVDDLVHIASL